MAFVLPSMPAHLSDEARDFGRGALIALTGEQGVLNWIVVKNEIRAAEAELAIAVAEREQLEETAARLRSDSLDLDYVEERARDILNVAHPREFIVEIEPSPQR